MTSFRDEKDMEREIVGALTDLLGVDLAHEVVGILTGASVPWRHQKWTWINGECPEAKTFLWSSSGTVLNDEHDEPCCSVPEHLLEKVAKWAIERGFGQIVDVEEVGESAYEEWRALVIGLQRQEPTAGAIHPPRPWKDVPELEREGWRVASASDEAMSKFEAMLAVKPKRPCPDCGSTTFYDEDDWCRWACARRGCGYIRLIPGALQ